MADRRAFRIDCDFHLPHVAVGDLVPYLDAHWAHQVIERELPAMPFRLQSYPAGSPLTHDPERRNEDVGRALDRLGTDIAIASTLHGMVTLHNPDMRAALLTALNEHVAQTWLGREPRLRGSVLVSPDEPAAAVAEIERRADDTRFVQVLMLAGQHVPHGNRLYWPIYEAAEAAGFTVAIHAGSLYDNPPSVSGWPSFQFEDYVLQAQIFENIVVSLLGEGVLQRFTKLNFAFLEAGFAWLPTTMWRNDKTWRGVRQEVPWLDRKPSEIMAGRMFWSLQPVDPPTAEDTARLVRHMGGTDMLLYSTDWPHRQFAGDEPLPEGLPAAALPGILARNALAAYPRLARDPAVARAVQILEDSA